MDGVGLYGGGPSNPASIPTQSQNLHSPKRNHQDQMGNHSPYQTVNPNDRRKKRKADVWNFFTEEDGHAICRCSKVYKYTSLNGTSTLRNHAIRCPMCADFPGNETNGVVPDKAPKAPRLSTSFSRSMDGRFSASNDGLNEQAPFISSHALANPLPGGHPNFMERHTACPPYSQGVDVLRAHKNAGAGEFWCASGCAAGRRKSGRIPAREACACKCARTKVDVGGLCARGVVVWV